MYKGVSKLHSYRFHKRRVKVGRLVKCKICNKEIDSSLAYTYTHISKTGKIYTKRCCSEGEYNEYQKEQDCRKFIFDFLKGIMKYGENQVLPTVVNKKLSELHMGYTYSTIHETFVFCKDNLEYWCNIDGKFNNEYQKISYIFAIIVNNINDVDKKLKREQELDRQKDNHTVDVDVFDITETAINKTNKKDISSFLD